MNRNQRRMAAYNARKSSEQIERDGYARKIESAFSRLSGEPVSRVCKALSCTEFKMNLRVKPSPEAITRENPEYRKVKNPYGQITNARQKLRGKSIPLI